MYQSVRVCVYCVRVCVCMFAWQDEGGQTEIVAGGIKLREKTAGLIIAITLVHSSARGSSKLLTPLWPRSKIPPPEPTRQLILRPAHTLAAPVWPHTVYTPLANLRKLPIIWSRPRTQMRSAAQIPYLNFESEHFSFESLFFFKRGFHWSLFTERSKSAL